MSIVLWYAQLIILSANFLCGFHCGLLSVLFTVILTLHYLTSHIHAFTIIAVVYNLQDMITGQLTTHLQVHPELIQQFLAAVSQD